VTAAARELRRARAACAVYAVLGLIALAGAGPARADEAPAGEVAGEVAREEEADRAFRAALERSMAGDPAAIERFEALAAGRPITRWTDNAYAEAARLAERAGDFARARRNLAQVVALGTDGALVARARAALDRLAGATGGGRWDAVAREHERLLAAVNAGGDPRAELARLEALVRANPAYPGATMVRLAIARGWERDGHGGRAIAQLRAALAGASAADRTRAGLELARTLIRQRDLDEAAAVLDALEAGPRADRAAIAKVREVLGVAERRAYLRGALWIALALIAACAALVLRRDAGSWRAAGRRLARPPVEVVFLVPIGVVLAAVAYTGNPLVAGAVAAIFGVGTAVAWISGAVLEAARARRGAVAARRALIQAVLAAVAVGGAAYLAIDRDRMIDLIAETWEHGPSPR
jgi:predicted negative regulator of RcsB-dependent stress response